MFKKEPPEVRRYLDQSGRSFRTWLAALSTSRLRTQGRGHLKELIAVGTLGLGEPNILVTALVFPFALAPRKGRSL
jgi:hypothetical protein